VCKGWAFTGWTNRQIGGCTGPSEWLISFALELYPGTKQCPKAWVSKNDLVADISVTRVCKLLWQNSEEELDPGLWWKVENVADSQIRHFLTTVWKGWASTNQGRCPRHTCDPVSRPCHNCCWILLIIFLPKTAFPRPVHKTHVCHFLIPANAVETVQFYIHVYYYYYY
jgi:hypothetical protein